MSDNPHPAWRRSRCEWCAKGLLMFPHGHFGQGYGHHQMATTIPLTMDQLQLGPKCTAPTESEYIAELEQNLAITREVNQFWGQRHDKAESRCRDLEASNAELTQQLAEARKLADERNEVCSVCCGKPLSSGAVCVCFDRGIHTGTRTGEMHGLRLEVLRLQKLADEQAEVLASLASMAEIAKDVDLRAAVLNCRQVADALARHDEAMRKELAPYQQRISQLEKLAYERGAALASVKHWLSETEQYCPCGARPESLNTHPHVIGCPVAAAIRTLKGSR